MGFHEPWIIGLAETSPILHAWILEAPLRVLALTLTILYGMLANCHSTSAAKSFLLGTQIGSLMYVLFTPAFRIGLTVLQIILIPELVGQSCLLVNDTLTATQLSNCSHINERAYGTFDHSIHGVGVLTGANTLDVAKIGIDEALLTVNASQVSDAYRRVHLELSIRDTIKADGIRPDGSFGTYIY